MKSSNSSLQSISVKCFAKMKCGNVFNLVKLSTFAFTLKNNFKLLYKRKLEQMIKQFQTELI